MTFTPPLPWMTVKMLLAVGVLYLIMMGSTFSSLGVVLPHMIAPLHMNWTQAGVGFTLLALAAGLSSVLPSLLIRRWNARITLLGGVLALDGAYLLMAVCHSVLGYDAAAVALGVGFSLIGAVPGLHVLSGWEQRRPSLAFGSYLACGGLGGAVWPSIVEWVIHLTGDWRDYWWFMAALISIAGALCLPVIRERSPAPPATGAVGATDWTLGEALKTPQFYLVGLGIAATYFTASTVNAFTFSYLTLIGIATAMAVLAFSVQSACHAAFPLLMGGVADRIGVKNLMIAGLALQAIGMAALAFGSSRSSLLLFAIGVGGGYGTVFLATTLLLQQYYGTRHYAAIFGANQMFTTISVVGPLAVGMIADRTGRFNESFQGCAALLLFSALCAALLRRPRRRALTAPASAAITQHV